MLAAPENEDWENPSIPRLADPELRSRVAGYLGRAGLARPGYRTDGVWVWPESLADRVRHNGIGPARALLEHVLSRNALLPLAVPPEAIAAASTTTAVRRCDEGDAAVYRAASALGADSPTDLLQVPRLAATRATVADGYWLTSTGWRAAHDVPSGVVRRSIPAHDVPPAVAGRLADELNQVWHDEALARGRESPPPSEQPRLGRVFDSVGRDGRPAFSPSRARIVELERRERLARYLAHGRMVVRATGRMPDPLARDDAPRVPLSIRTDGVWVWCEALAYYVSTRGVAPELELLCHIEEQAYMLPGDIPDDVARQAGIVAQRPPVPLPKTTPGYYTGPSGALFRRWDSHSRPEVLDTDLRWRRCVGDWTLPWHEVSEISEADAARAVDARLGLITN